jgi:hypothetical protein
VKAALGSVAIWSVVATGLLARARQMRPFSPLLRLAPLSSLLWGVAGAAVFGALLAFTSLSSMSALPLVLGGPIAVAALSMTARRPTATGTRTGTGTRRRPRRGARAIDAGVVGLILLAVPDLVIFQPASSASPFLRAFEVSVVQFHQNFVLGPANQVIHGGAMLVDTASQYGVGTIYFLAGWFHLAPIGYGTLGFLDGALFALVFAAAYCVLRLAGTPKWLSTGALALAVVALIYNLVYSVGSLVAQHGPLRFGLPVVLIFAAVGGARFPRRARLAHIAGLAVVGISSIWALEGFAYTAVTFAALTCFDVWARPGAQRRRRLFRRAAEALIACAAAHLLLVAATLLYTGQLPDYGQYLGFLNAFVFGTVGNITFDFSRWSPALAVGVAYAASAVALVLLIRRRRDVVEREWPALVALCGVTAYGTILFSYFVDRSADHILPYVSLPALLAGVLWLGLLLRGALRASRAMRLGGLAFALSLALLLTSVAWSSVGPRFPRSALGHVVPGGASLGGALHHLWHLPALDSRAPRGETLVARFMPHRQRVLSLVSPDLEAEIFIRSSHTNQLPLTYPTEDSFVSGQYLPGLRRTVAELRAGDRLLTQTDGLEVFASLKADPMRNPLAHPLASNLAPLQQWVLQQVGRRFDLKVIYRDDQGFVVAELAPRA